VNTPAIPPNRSDTPGEKSAPPKEREPDALYQNNKIVARVLDPEIDLDAKELRFGEIYASDELMIPDECEFQKYRILIQRIGFATRGDRAEIHKGRILRGVGADLLGFLE
jgi:hypothetical protein